MKSTTLSPDGTLAEPALHDGELFGIVSCEDRRVLVLVRRADGTDVCLVLLGVERLRADDLREGNIILDITIQSEESAGVAEDVAEAYGIALGDPYLATVLERVNAGDLKVLRVNPSYGCSLVAVCQEVAVTNDWMNEIENRETRQPG